jgi:hypothetical protein
MIKILGAKKTKRDDEEAQNNDGEKVVKKKKPGEIRLKKGKDRLF